MTIPRRFIPGLQGRPSAALESVSVSPAGDALRWSSLDADVYLPGLVERAFGNRLFAAAADVAGADAVRKPNRQRARRNGSKGGGLGSERLPEGDIVRPVAAVSAGLCCFFVVERAPDSRQPV